MTLAALLAVLYGYPSSTTERTILSSLCPTKAPASPTPSLAVFSVLLGKALLIPSTIGSTSIRVAHTASSKLSLFFRANYTPSSTESRALSALTSQNVNTQTYTLGATSQLSSSVNNEFRLGYGGSSSSRTTMLDSFGGAQFIDLQKAMT